jgi:ATP:corrinoid adenosyltransferase
VGLDRRSGRDGHLIRRPGHQHVIITGRDTHPNLILAELISDPAA